MDRIGLDLEKLGKSERQKGLETWISPHEIEDLDRIRPGVRRAALFVRVNPINDGSRKEVDGLLRRGVSVIMLPNFERADEVERFLHIVGGRARVVPLVERAEAVASIPALARLGIDEIHVGLNDLSIDLGLSCRLAVLASPAMNRLSRVARESGLRLGLGGLARAMDLALPVPSDLVYAQHARLGATGTLLARSFFRPDMSEAEFAREVTRLRARLTEWAAASPADLDAARLELARRAAAIGQAETAAR